MCSDANRDPPRAILLDLEGVLYQDGRAIPGAVEAVEALARRGLALRFLTNTTTAPRRRIAERLRDFGFDVAEDQVLSPARAAATALAEAGVTRLHLGAEPALAEDFEGFDLVGTAPQAVLLGDLHRGFTWERLNDLFVMLSGGARLVALHRNRYCRREGELALDLGPFVAALEYAADCEAMVVGKPAGAFFGAALADIGCAPDEALMVGDDIEADILGARQAGLAALQVETGKFRAEDAERSDAPARLGSIADLPDWLDRQS